MKLISVAMALLTVLMIEDTHADPDLERARLYAPILILTKDGQEPTRKVIHPESVQIMGAESIDNLWFNIGSEDVTSFSGWAPTLQHKMNDLDLDVNFLQNKFAFLPSRFSYSGTPYNKSFGTYIVKPRFDYPGNNSTTWNDAYEEGDKAGKNFPNTAYVNVFKDTISHISDTTEKKDQPVTVFQYWYFYPYNDWWNKHEGDWQLINVVVTGVVVGVEYLFHEAHLTYYDDDFLRSLGYNLHRPKVKNISTHNPKFNPREEIRLSGLSHPIVYVGVGSHAAYPTGGTYRLLPSGILLGSIPLPNAIDERMSHTGLVLSTQADNSHSDLWESYNLVLLPEPVPDSTNNMGLTSNMSWLGSNVRWGDLEVSSPSTINISESNESPIGPYHKDDWEVLRFLSQGRLLGQEVLLKDHTIIPYDNDNKFYHSFIFSDEIWNSASGNIELDGDIVIFPGATLTIAPGTNIRFDRNTDTKKHDLGRDDRAEIFVYGTLQANGTAQDPVVFGGAVQSNREELWGGIREVGSGQAILTHTKIRNAPPAKPRILTVEPSNNTATITWDNGGDPSVGLYQTRMKTEAASAWPDWGALASDTTYTETNLTNGVRYLFSVRAINQFASYSDGDEWVNSDSLVVEVTPVGPPEPPELTVAAGHEKVRVRWSPGANNGSKITGHKWRYKAGAADWNPDWTSYATPEQIIRNLDNDTTYTFQMKSKNKVGYSEVVEVQATPRHPIEGPTAISFAENSDDPVASYRFAPAELDQSEVAYRLKLSDIADSGLFELDSQGRLRFQDTPDFETPTDADGNNLYTVWLKAAPASGNEGPVAQANQSPTFTKQVAVTVTDVPSTIALSPLPPQVGVPLTAALTDPDRGITSTSWQWQGQAPGTTKWQTLSSTSSAKAKSSYTPKVAQVGWTLRAVANSYRNVGLGKRIESMVTAPVQAGKPAAPVVSAQRRDGAIDLHIVLGADNGSPIKQVERRISHINGEEMVSVQWRRDPIDPNNKYRPYPSLFTLGFISPWDKLTNGKAYTFAVRTVNGKGASAVASVTATPAGRPGAPPHVMPSPGDGQVVLRWDAAEANGAAIEWYEVQWRTAKSKRGGSNWASVPGGHTARDSTITGLANGVLYEFSVRAVNEMGAGASASQSARPQAGLVRLPLTASRGDRQVALKWTAPSKRVSVHEYQVRHRISDSGQDWSSWSPVSGGSTARNSTITGLTNGVVYQFAVQAVDSRRTAVAVSDVVSATPAGRPGTPTLTASGGPGQVRLKWTAADANGSTILRYEYRRTDSSASDGWTDWRVAGNRDDRSTIVTGLTNGTRYTFELRAVNGVGAGSADSDTALPQVGRVSLTASRGDGQVALKWTAPSTSVSVHEYQVRHRISDSGQDWSSWSGVSGGSTARDSTITGLTNGVAYQFAVQAVNSQDAPVAVSDVVSATPAGRPGTPALTAVGGNGQVRLGWTAAAANGSAITRYEMQWRVANSGHGWPDWADVPGGGTARDSTVAGLLNGTEYEFAVRAVNGVGAGGSASQAATPQASSMVVSFGSVSYQAAEGGSAVPVSVGLSPSASQTVRIPVVVSADKGTEPGDYTVAGLTNGTVWLSFASGTASQSFTITANDDDDIDDETVSLSFGKLPAGVVAKGTTRQATVTLLDDDEDTSPVFVPSSGTEDALVGSYFSFTRPSASGGNGSLSYSASGSCPGLNVTDSSVSGQPSTAGQCGISWTATDTDGDKATYSLQISVYADTSPVFVPSSGTEDALVGHYFSFTRPSASGGNGSLSYSVSGTCPGLSVTVSSVSGQPSTAGQCGISWTATDTDGDKATYSLQISVYADTSPVFVPSSGTEDALVGHYFSFTRPSASGGNGSLSYSVSGTCPGLSVTASSVSGQPSTAGQCGISWTATDTDGDKATYSLQISVYADTSPSFASSGTSRSAIVGQYFSFTRPSASGGNGSLSYSVSGTCPGLSVTTSSVSGQPSSSGQCGITWTVRDSDGDTDTYSLQISVAADTSPSFASSGTSRSAIVGSYFSFTRPSASGGNGSLSYSVSGTCPGLSVTTSSVSGQWPAEFVGSMRDYVDGARQ